MANRIKGITIEIGGDTTGLTDALKGVNKQLSSTQAALRDTDKLLKLDPSNTTLLEQKQGQLSQAIEQTKEKLKQLEAAQESAAAALQRGDIGQQQYEAFQREIEATKGSLQRYEDQARQTDAEQEQLKQGTEALKRFFETTGTTVDDFADALGPKLESSIRSGTASVDEMKRALETMGSSMAGTEVKISGFDTALDDIAGASKAQALEALGEAAEGVADKLGELGSASYESFSEMENATTKVNGYFGETGAAAQQSADVIKSVYGAGLGESMDSVANAVIQVKQQLGDLSDTDLNNITQQALILEETFGVDMSESLRGVSALMDHFGLDAQTAMDYLVTGTQNGLNYTDELGDNLSEYSGKFAEAGYSTSEYFQLLQNGAQGGAYNLDKINDAINEVTTRLGDGTIEKSIGIYSQKTQELFTAWQNGGASQKEVIDSIVADIQNCNNQQDQLNMATTAFGTMAEDGGTKFVSALTSVGNTYDDVTGKAQQMNDATTTPMQQLQGNVNSLQMALAPLGETLASLANSVLPPITNMVKKLSEGFANLPGPVQGVIAAMGTLAFGATKLIQPVSQMLIIGSQLKELELGGKVAEFGTKIGGLGSKLKGLGLGAKVTELGTKIGGLGGKIGGLMSSIAGMNPMILVIVAAIAAAIAVGILLYKNWDTIKAKAEALGAAIGPIFQTIGNVIQTVFSGIVNVVTTVWNTISGIFTTIATAIGTVLSTIGTTILTTLSGIWTGIQTAISGALEILKTLILGPILIITDLITGNFKQIPADIIGIFGNLGSGLMTVLSGIGTIFSSVFNGIKTIVLTIGSAIVNGAITVFKGMVTGVKTIVNSVKTVFVSGFNAVKSAVNSAVNAIKNTAVKVFTSMVTGIKSAVMKIPGVVKSGMQGAINFLKNLPKQALKWGSDFISGFAKGIRSAFHKVTGAVSDLGNKIRGALHFSRPDYGPLRDYEKWMPDFMKGLAKGIRDNSGLVTDALGTLTGGMAGTVAPVTSNSYSYGPMTVTVNAAPGMDERTLARQVMAEINRGVRSKKAVTK